MAILTRGLQVDKYTIQSLIKDNLNTETFCVEDEYGNPYFMKMFVVKRMPEKLMNAGTGNVLEIDFCQRLILLSARCHSISATSSTIHSTMNKLPCWSAISSECSTVNRARGTNVIDEDVMA